MGREVGEAAVGFFAVGVEVKRGACHGIPLGRKL
jgi:hypothetical protein